MIKIGDTLTKKQLNSWITSGNNYAENTNLGIISWIKDSAENGFKTSREVIDIDKEGDFLRVSGASSFIKIRFSGFSEFICEKCSLDNLII